MTCWPSLGIETDEWTRHHRIDKTAQFDAAEGFLESVREFLQGLEVGSRDPRQIMASALLARGLELHSAVIVTLARGMITPTRVILRALLETTFTAAAIARDPEFVRRYIRQDDVTRFRTLNRLRQSVS